jgi:hypothetical protein
MRFIRKAPQLMRFPRALPKKKSETIGNGLEERDGQRKTRKNAKSNDNQPIPTMASAPVALP